MGAKLCPVPEKKDPSSLNFGGGGDGLGLSVIRRNNTTCFLSLLTLYNVHANRFTGENAALCRHVCRNQEGSKSGNTMAGSGMIPGELPGLTVLL